MTIQPITFFDVRGTLGAVRSFKTESVLHVYPYLRSVHRDLRADHSRFGLACRLCPCCDRSAEAFEEMLARADVAEWFEPSLRHYATESPSFFEEVRRANPGRCLYVSRDAVALEHASRAGFEVVPHPLLARAVLGGEALHRLEVWGAGAAAFVEGVHAPGVVALDLIDTSRVLVVASDTGCKRLERAGLRIAPFGHGEASTASLARIRNDTHPRNAARVRARTQASSIDTRHARYVPLAAGTLPEVDHVHGAFQLVFPDPTLSLGRIEQLGARTPESSWSDQERAAIDAISPEAIARDLETLIACGAPEGSSIGSRHVQHAGNARCVEWLLERLESIGGLQVSRHCFSHAGMTLHNVEAELPGESAEIVIVSAHLDSIALSFIHPNHPETDPAPGADDDGSGVAAVIAIANAFVQLASLEQRTRRTLRFVLFNAEEAGMVGSAAYAGDAVLRGESIAAVYQMDMIGYRKVDDEVARPCEIHIGASSNPSAQVRSVPLATWVSDAIEGGLGRSVSRPELFDSRGGDLADGRSDHSQFHARDIAACLVCEDHWSQGTDPDFYENPNYHSARDVEFVADYIADMARVVAAAAMQASRLDDRHGQRLKRFDAGMIWSQNPNVAASK
jgi:bacterial leucyl aminopeptidase